MKGQYEMAETNENKSNTETKKAKNTTTPVCYFFREGSCMAGKIDLLHVRKCEDDYSKLEETVTAMIQNELDYIKEIDELKKLIVSLKKSCLAGFPHKNTHETRTSEIVVCCETCYYGIHCLDCPEDGTVCGDTSVYGVLHKWKPSNYKPEETETMGNRSFPKRKHKI